MNAREAKKQMLRTCAADLRAHEGSEMTVCNAHTYNLDGSDECRDCERLAAALLEIADELERRAER